MGTKNFENELGRSMVEMLGTLAIVGVLSIGGIAGYSYGMDKYRANETINDVNLRGIDLVAQVSMGRTTLSLSEWPTVSKAGYDISEPVLSIEGDAYFTISGVPKRVCEMVYEGVMQNQTTDVEINGYVVDDSSTCGDDNMMGFFFITNAGEKVVDLKQLCDNVTCPDGYSCTHGICMSEEIPQINTGYRRCNTDNACGECQYCAENSYDEYRGSCASVADGTLCNGGTCKSGCCIANACETHDDCSFGYYCGMGESGYYCGTYNNCIKAEFSKIVLGNMQQTVYLTKENLSTFMEKVVTAEEYCNRAGLTLISKEVFLSDYFLNEFKTKVGSGNGYFITSDGSYSLNKSPYFPYDQYFGHAVCVEYDSVWAETETTTGG